MTKKFKEVLPTFEELKATGGFTPIPNFSNYLCHTETGRVYSLLTNRWLLSGECKGTGDNGKYLMTKLKDDNGKSVPMYLHEIVMSCKWGDVKQSWIDMGMQVHHEDKNTRNNKDGNLLLVTDEENKADSSYRGWNKVRITFEVAEQLRREFEQRNCSKMEWYKAKGKELGVTFRSVQNVILGNTYKEVAE